MPILYRQPSTNTLRLFINFGPDPSQNQPDLAGELGYNGASNGGQQNGQEPRREHIVPFPWPYIRGNTQIRLEINARINDSHLIVRFSRRS